MASLSLKNIYKVYPNGFNAVKAVSYTHLDVYKRQMLAQGVC